MASGDESTPGTEARVKGAMLVQTPLLHQHHFPTLPLVSMSPISVQTEASKLVAKA